MKIFHRDTGSLLLEIEADTLVGVDLSRANLGGANLRGANLSFSNLVDADFIGANLIDANISRADLSGADLSGVDLCGADLSGADLSGAYLIDANMIGANLSRVDLRGAYLRGANLICTDLNGANLSGANLIGANIEDADLTAIRDDFFKVLAVAPNEIATLRSKFVEGGVNGCLVGTIAKAMGCDYRKIDGLKHVADGLIEVFFAAIRPGMKEDHPIVKIVISWIDEFVTKNKLTNSTKEG